MEPKFSQFKKIESELEKIPKIKSEAHFELNDISKKVSLGEINEKDIDSLELIYDLLQDLEKNLVSNLDDYRSRGILSKEEFLVAVNYFLIAKQNGPESSKLLEVFLSKDLNENDCFQLIHSISIPEHTKNILSVVYFKMVNQ